MFHFAILVGFLVGRTVQEQGDGDGVVGEIDRYPLFTVLVCRCLLLSLSFSLFVFFRSLSLSLFVFFFLPLSLYLFVFVSLGLCLSLALSLFVFVSPCLRLSCIVPFISFRLSNLGRQRLQKQFYACVIWQAGQKQAAVFMFRCVAVYYG